MSWYFSSQKTLISSKRYCCLCSDRPDGDSVGGSSELFMLASGFKIGIFISSFVSKLTNCYLFGMLFEEVKMMVGSYMRDMVVIVGKKLRPVIQL